MIAYVLINKNSQVPQVLKYKESLQIERITELLK